jgi:hypothetical protein
MANDIALAIDSVLTQNKMRKQLNELSEIARDLRNLLADNFTIIDSPIDISDSIRVYSCTVNYMTFHFQNDPGKLEIGIYENESFERTTISIDIDRVNDELLEEIILRSKQEIAIFKQIFESESILKRKARIIELQEELKNLSNVHTS